MNYYLGSLVRGLVERLVSYGSDYAVTLVDQSGRYYEIVDIRKGRRPNGFDAPLDFDKDDPLPFEDTELAKLEYETEDKRRIAELEYILANPIPEVRLTPVGNGAHALVFEISEIPGQRLPEPAKSLLPSQKATAPKPVYVRKKRR